MNVMKNGAGFGSYAISLGNKVLRGGRMRKVGSQVVSYSPHVAEMFGTASRAVIGGLIAIGGVAATPAMAGPFPTFGIGEIQLSDAHINLIVNADEEISGSEYGMVGVAEGAGNVVLTNDGTVNVSVGDSSSLGLTGAAAFSKGGGNIHVINNGLLSGQALGVWATQFPGASGLIEVVNRGYIAATNSGGIGISASHVGGGDGAIHIDNQGSVMGRGIGIAAVHERAGNITVDNALDATIYGKTAGVSLVQMLSGTVTVNNDGSIKSFKGNAVHAAHGGAGDIAINNSGTIKSKRDSAVSAIHLGQGNVVVTNTGSIKSRNGAAIDLTHEGTGDLTVNLNAVAVEEDGEVSYLDNVVRSSRDDAIVLNHSNIGNINVNSAVGSEVYGEEDAFDLRHAGEGDINVNIAGSVDSEDGYIAYLQHSGVGNINFNVLTGGDLFSDAYGVSLYAASGADSDVFVTTQAGTEIDADDVALEIEHNGVGDVVLDIAGMVESDDSSAISIAHNGNGLIDVTLASTAEVNAERSGIALVRQNSSGSGITNVTTQAGSLIDAVSNGIYIRNAASGLVALDLAGDIVSGDFENEDDDYRTDGGSGVYAVQYGRGDLTVDLSGSIDVAGLGLQLYLSNSGVNAQVGDLLVDVAQGGSITAGDAGIQAFNYRVGALNITNAGIIDGYVAGIDATHYGVGELNIANSGTIYSNFTGIIATHTGAELLSVVNSGSIISKQPAITVNSLAPNAGIYASRDKAGDIRISNSGVNSLISGFDIGILAEHYDRDNIAINNAGSIIGNTYEITGPDDIAYMGGGIFARHNGTGVKSISVTNSGTIKAGFGIDVGFDGCSADGDFAIDIDSTGSILANGGDGIYAFNNTGSIDILANDVTADDYYSVAIYAGNYSKDAISITTTGEVMGNWAAVSVESFGGPIALTIGANSHVKNLSGESDDLAVILRTDENVGSNDLTLTNNGLLTGAIDLQNGTGGGSSVVINGVWDNRDATNSFTRGEDKVVINGVWDARGSTNYFDGVHHLGRMAFVPADYPDSVTVNAGSTLIVGGTDTSFGTSFDNLDLLHVKGKIASNNGLANDFTQTTGSIAFDAGSILSVDAGDNGAVDLIRADGDVFIDGGTLQLTFIGDSKPEIGSTYDVLSGATVVGAFDNTEIMNTAFRGWDIDYVEDVSGEIVRLEYKQIRSFEDLALTPNDAGIAGALGDLDEDSPLIEALLETPTEAAARQAYSMLSGEIHPGARTALMEDSRLTRNAVLERLNDPQGGQIWGQLFANSGDNDGQAGNSMSKLNRDSWGFIAGGDLPLSEDVVAGIAAGYISTDLEQRGVAAKGKAETIHALAYVGGASGSLRYKAGVGYAWGDIETTRTVVIGDFSDTMRADYNANLFQAFAELGYRLPLGGGSVEPIANVTYLRAKSDGFTEIGGAAALKATSAKDSNTLTTVGARFETAQTGIFSVNAMAGWQHAFGTLAPVSSFRLADSDAFRVAGVAQSRDAAVATIEGLFDLSETTSLGVSYDGVIGSAGEDHAAKLNFRVKF